MDRLPGKKATITQAMDSVRDQLRISARTQEALKVTATNVMIADTDYNIRYVNDSLGRMLVEAEADIQKQLPAFSAKGVIGTNIELAKFDFGAGLKHHLIPLSWVDHTDDKVHLSLTKDEAKAAWREKH